MYRFPKDVDWSFLVGRELTQLCFGVHDIIFNFGEGVSISGQGTVDHVVQGEMHRSSQEKGKGYPSTMVSLLGHKIFAVRRQSGEELCIDFSNEQTLKLWDVDDVYESFTVLGHADGEIVI